MKVLSFPSSLVGSRIPSLHGLVFLQITFFCDLFLLPFFLFVLSLREVGGEDAWPILLFT